MITSQEMQILKFGKLPSVKHGTGIILTGKLHALENEGCKKCRKSEKKINGFPETLQKEIIYRQKRKYRSRFY